MCGARHYLHFEELIGGTSDHSIGVRQFLASRSENRLLREGPDLFHSEDAHLRGELMCVVGGADRRFRVALAAPGVLLQFAGNRCGENFVAAFVLGGSQKTAGFAVSNRGRHANACIELVTNCQ